MSARDAVTEILNSEPRGVAVRDEAWIDELKAIPDLKAAIRELQRSHVRLAELIDELK